MTRHCLTAQISNGGDTKIGTKPLINKKCSNRSTDQHLQLFFLKIYQNNEFSNRKTKSTTSENRSEIKKTKKIANSAHLIQNRLVSPVDLDSRVDRES